MPKRQEPFSLPNTRKPVAAKPAAPTLTEEQIHIQVMDWWGLACHGFKVDIRLLMHTPNGGKRGIRQAVRFKRMGVRAGWPDLFLSVPRECVLVEGVGPKSTCRAAAWHGLFVEMKKPGGRLEPSQREIHALLTAQGYAVMVAWSFDEAVTYISNYLTTGNAFAKPADGGKGGKW